MYLTHEQISILEYIEKNSYIDKAIAFRLFSPTSDYSIDELLNEKYIYAIDPPTIQEFIWYVLTPKGRSFLSDYHQALHNSNTTQKKQLLYNVYIPLIVTLATNLIIEIVEFLL